MMSDEKQNQVSNVAVTATERLADATRDEEAIFLEALQKTSPEEQAAFLDQACAGDQSLRKSIEQLLTAHERRGDFLQAKPGPSPSLDQPLTERRGTVIGPYKLMEQIGEGGMGLVFVAEQQQPVRRKVALKLIKPGMDTREVIARFEAERQALALMDHPNIARVLDAGATESGRPYFVMELVRGVPITNYCDQNNLPVSERLELFVTVCHAVQHAHQKGIIHRDIKPSNVMISLHDGKPIPKVIDFGVAKATNQQLTDKTLYTSFAQMIGTPLYMSPEQAEMISPDVDTRSDIYSLGVLLYELLTGTTPFDKERLKKVALDEIRRIIRDDEPAKPSTRIGTLVDTTRSAVAAQRRIDGSRLSQIIRGDLDWIVMKSLEKDRTRRYDTASHFAADVLRHLNDQPVEACPPSKAYRFRKFARRNRVAITTAALVSAALVLGTAVSTWQAIRATVARKEADANAELVRGSMDRLVRSYRLIESGDLHARQTRWPEALGDFTQAVELRPENPLGWNRRANLYLDLYLWDLATEDYSRSFETHTSSEASIWSDHALLRLFVGDTEGYAQICARMPKQFDTAGVRNAWWIARTCTMSPSASIDADRVLVEAGKAAHSDPQSLSYLFTLGAAHYRAGQFEKAIERLREVTQRDNGWTNSEAWPMLAMAYYRVGQVDEAHRWLDKTYQGFEETLREVCDRAGHPNLFSRNKIDLLSLHLLYREAHALIGSSHPIDDSLLLVLQGLGHSSLGQSDQALASFSQAIREQPDCGNLWLARGLFYAIRGEWSKAASDCTKAVMLKPEDPSLVFDCAAILYLAGDTEAYRQVCSQALGRLGPDVHPGYAYLLTRAGTLIPDKSFDTARLESLAEQAITAWPTCAWCLQTAGTAHYRAGHLDQALARLHESLRADPGWSGKHVTWLVLAMIESRVGHVSEAQRWLKQAEDWMGYSQQRANKTASGELLQANEWLAYVILHREAEALVSGHPIHFDE